MAARKNCFLVAPAIDCAYTSDCAYAKRPCDNSEESEHSDDAALQPTVLKDALQAAALQFNRRTDKRRADTTTSEDDFLETGHNAAVEAVDKQTLRPIFAKPRRGRPPHADDRDACDHPPGEKRPVGRPPRGGRDRRPDIFRFFLTFKRIERKGDYVSAKHTPGVNSADLLLEFANLSGPMKYYWVHMFELWRLYERQQLARSSPATDAHNARRRRRDMLLEFYYLDLAQQKILVDDWIVERTGRHRERAAAELETCLARKTLLKIKTDMLAMVSNIDFVLRDGLLPHKWQGAFHGI
jgi:hypothetical protein